VRTISLTVFFLIKFSFFFSSLFFSFDSRLQSSDGAGKLVKILILPSTGGVHMRVDMLDSKRGGRLLQLAVALLALLSIFVGLGAAAEVVETGASEVVTKQTDSRASRAKRRGGTDVLRG